MSDEEESIQVDPRVVMDDMRTLKYGLLLVAKNTFDAAASYIMDGNTVKAIKDIIQSAALLDEMLERYYNYDGKNKVATTSGSIAPGVNDDTVATCVGQSCSNCVNGDLEEDIQSSCYGMVWCIFFKEWKEPNGSCIEFFERKD